MQLIRTLFLLLGIASTYADHNDDRLSNAASVITALLNATNVNHKGVPYITVTSEVPLAFGIIGGLLKYYHNKKVENKELGEMNARFDLLESDMEKEFLQLEAFIAYEQFQTDIIDPLTIMSGYVMAYVNHPSTGTWTDVSLQCRNHQAWQIATKLNNRMNGGDNNYLMVQTIANQYDNQTFMMTKDMIMYTAYQTVMLEAFCQGLANGPNYNVSDGYYYNKTYGLYQSTMNQTIASRVSQERDYLSRVSTDIIRRYVTSSNTKSFSSFADSIYMEMRQHYDWDHFEVILTKPNCYGNGQEIAWCPRTGSAGYQRASIFSLTVSNFADAHIIRYWRLPSSNSGYRSTFNSRLQDSSLHGNGRAEDWSCRLEGSPIDFVFISTNWWCADATAFFGYSDNSLYSDIPYQNGYNGYGTGISANPQRPTTVEFDLGFYDRPIDIKLMPFDS